MKVFYISNSIQHRETNRLLGTLVLLTSKEEIKINAAEWVFDWKKELEQYPVYKLVLAETPEIIQGLMSIEIREGYIFVSLIENAPFNRGVDKIYRGVAVNLFAFACKLSAENGFEGYVAFEAKTDLIAYYQKILDAKQIGKSNRMFIDQSQAQKLIQLHFPK